MNVEPPGGWDIEQPVELCGAWRTWVSTCGPVDLSTDGKPPTARSPVAKRYQARCSRRIRNDAGIPTGTVRLIRR